jgi:hypothetical protein
MLNYYLTDPGRNEDVKVWAQMFFDDGSVTQGKYIHRGIYYNENNIKTLAREFLEDTCRKEGVLFIWGAGTIYAKRVDLFLLKGRETLRLRRL